MTRLLALVCCLLAGSVSAQCRQALAPGLDVSGSVDVHEYRLQLDGLAAALRRPEIRKIILANPAFPVRLAVFEWSEPGHQRVLLEWTQIRTESDLSRIAARLGDVTRSATPQGTAVGDAFLFGADLLNQQPECWKRTLDLSGDGKHNLGLHPRDAKALFQDTGITINGLTTSAFHLHAWDGREGCGFLGLGVLQSHFRTIYGCEHLSSAC